MAAAVDIAAYKDVLIILASTAVTVPIQDRHRSVGFDPAPANAANADDADAAVVVQ